jgi:hypothetical protein
MRLQDLYTNFSNLPPTDQENFIVSYRARRAKEFELFELEEATKKKVSTTRQTTTKLSPDEENLIKLLGITKKQYLSLKALKDAEQ